jgi:uncharacterized protein (UPF0332 family)
MKAFAQAEWERARRALASAGQLVESDPDSAASRAYYAAFHALTALFAQRTQVFSKHSALRAALHRDLIQPGLLDENLGRDYDFLLELREAGDYGDLAHVPVEAARQAVEKARAILAALPQIGGAGR